MENKWIEWSDGECPVPDAMLVDVIFRDGRERERKPACEMWWRSSGGIGGLPDDIVKYRISQANPATDSVNHPKHYNTHPSGIECIQITEHMGFNLGNAVKYIWRADEKGNALEDLKKAAWYIDREIQKRGK